MPPRDANVTTRDVNATLTVANLIWLGGDDFDVMVKAVNLNSLGGGFNLNDCPYGDEEDTSPSMKPSTVRPSSPYIESASLRTPSSLNLFNVFV